MPTRIKIRTRGVHPSLAPDPEAAATIPRPKGGVVQLVRTPACHAGGRGFESRRSRSISSRSWRVVRPQLCRRPFGVQDQPHGSTARQRAAPGRRLRVPPTRLRSSSPGAVACGVPAASSPRSTASSRRRSITAASRATWSGWSTQAIVARPPPRLAARGRRDSVHAPALKGIPGEWRLFAVDPPST